MGRRDLDKRLQRALSRARNTDRRLREAARASAAPKVSPLAPTGGFPDLPIIAGVEFATVAAGIRYRGRDDVMLARLAPGSVLAGVTTRSATRAAPVLDCEDKLASAATSDAGAAIIVNAGNANAFTGGHGRAAVAAVTGAVAKALGLPDSRVLSSSTGVIGEPLPHDRITASVAELAGRLAPGGWEAAARAIMTTDTFAKGAGRTVDLSGGPVSIAGFAKGSGMIAPDMATMLVYLFTDAALPATVLQNMIRRQCDRSFNSITVDSDTSTSDTLLMGATGASGVAVEPASRDAELFEAALGDVMRDLALQVVRDGEGATKLLEVRVTGAASDDDARKVALAIANSPLVKTAVAGEDPNWGRVVMAVGKSGAKADRDLLSIRFGDITVAEKGWISPDYTEEAGATYMQNPELVLGVEMGLGRGAATVWTCDLTYDYIRINADYRS